MGFVEIAMRSLFKYMSIVMSSLVQVAVISFPLHLNAVQLCDASTVVFMFLEAFLLSDVVLAGSTSVPLVTIIGRLGVE